MMGTSLVAAAEGLVDAGGHDVAREPAHQALGRQVLQRLRAEVGDVALDGVHGVDRVEGLLNLVDGVVA